VSRRKARRLRELLRQQRIGKMNRVNLLLLTNEVDLKLQCGMLWELNIARSLVELASLLASEL